MLIYLRLMVNLRIQFHLILVYLITPRPSQFNLMLKYQEILLFQQSILQLYIPQTTYLLPYYILSIQVRFLEPYTILWQHIQLKPMHLFIINIDRNIKIKFIKTLILFSLCQTTSQTEICYLY